MNTEKKIERKRIGNGVEIVRAAIKDIDKTSRISTCISIIVFIFYVASILITFAFAFNAGIGKKDSMSYYVKLIENYYKDEDPIEYNNKSYEIINGFNKEEDDAIYINAYYGENKSNGDIFAIKNNEAHYISINNSYDKIREWAFQNGNKIKNIRINDRKNLTLYVTVEYEFGGMNLEKEIQTYYPTGEITFVNIYNLD